MIEVDIYCVVIEIIKMWVVCICKFSSYDILVYVVFVECENVIVYV